MFGALSHGDVQKNYSNSERFHRPIRVMFNEREADLLEVMFSALNHPGAFSLRFLENRLLGRCSELRALQAPEPG